MAMRPKHSFDLRHMQPLRSPRVFPLVVRLPDHVNTVTPVAHYCNEPPTLGQQTEESFGRVESWLMVQEQWSLGS